MHKNINLWLRNRYSI